MKLPKGIYFEEVPASPADLLSEVASSGQKRRTALSSSAARTLRRQQVSRLGENIVLLRRKQEEFNRKMEEYIQNIRALAGSLERSLGAEEREPDSETGRRLREGTQVRCLSCGEETEFQDLTVLVDCDGSESGADLLIVDDGGELRKGSFSCPLCGNENLLIRKLCS